MGAKFGAIVAQCRGGRVMVGLVSWATSGFIWVLWVIPRSTGRGRFPGRSGCALRCRACRLERIFGLAGSMSTGATRHACASFGLGLALVVLGGSLVTLRHADAGR
jgi:hypothetical protein